MRLFPVVILILAFAGCGASVRSRQFVGTITGGGIDASSKRVFVSRTFDIRHAREGLIGFELEGVGTLVFVYQATGDGDAKPCPSTKFDGYVFRPSPREPGDLDRFIGLDAAARADVPEARPLNGKVTVEKWNGSWDFRIAIDATAVGLDQERTRFSGVLDSREEPVPVGTTWGFGPL